MSWATACWSVSWSGSKVAQRRTGGCATRRLTLTGGTSRQGAGADLYAFGLVTDVA